MADFAHCENIIKQNSSSFYHAFKHLPEKDKNAVFSIYAFCRVTDDSIDEHNDFLELQSIRKSLLKSFRQEHSNNMIFECLREVLQQYSFDQYPFLDLIRGMEDDFNQKIIETDADLKEYCYKVAGTVGLMLTPIIASSQYEQKKEQLREVSIQLGYAMQITNILRDVGKDYRNNRIYLPNSLLKTYDVTLADIIKNGPDKNYKRLMKHYIKKAKNAYRFFYRNIFLYNKDAILPTYMAAKYYEAILNEIKRNHYDNISRRNYITDHRKKWILLISRLKLKWRNIL